MKHIFQKCLKNTQDSHPLSTVNKQTKSNFFNNDLFSVTTSLGTVRLFSLFLPLFFSNITNNLIGTINTAVLSGYSENAVAATGTANTLINLFSLLTSTIATGASVVISNFIGAEQLKKASRTNFTAIVSCGCIGATCSVMLFIFSAPLMKSMNLTGEVLSQAILYFKIRVCALIISTLSSIFSSVMQCYGYTKYSVIASITSVFCNLVFNVYVVYFPQYSLITGVKGIAVGSVVSQIISFMLLFRFFIKVKIKIAIPTRIKEFFAITIRILKIGLPTALSNGSFTLSQVITTSFVATLGTYAISAKVYYTNILCYAYLFSMNLGNANALLIGRLTGAGRYEHAKRLNLKLIRITTLVNLTISLTIILLRVPILNIFTNNSQIIKMSLGILIVDIITEQARAVSQIYEYALRAAGDVAFTMVVVTLSCWCCSVGLAYFLSIPCKLGLIGVWIGLAIDETIRAVSTFFRWRSNKWIGILKP